MSKAAHARSGGGKVSIAKAAREGQGTISKMIVEPAEQPAVPSNIPGSDSSGVPPASPSDLAAFTRTGADVGIRRKTVAAMRGQLNYGPDLASSVARTGGQVQVAPGQFGVWSRPLSM